ncbi:MAG: hydantoinase/oxoprolinase family protein [Gammaproteobacteria bacterium]|nr:hydantoinase/oxoprolinase family protein [Gammaproteobacteria bacterium]
MNILGVDTGGTFTDFVLFDGTHLRVHKLLSTPEAPERAILQGIEALGLDPRQLRIVHGSTVATNAVLEGKGARTVYIANHGMADLLSIGRQARDDIYELQPTPKPPPVVAELCLETGGRTTSTGETVEALTTQHLNKLRQQIEALAPQAVAINLLFSYVDDQHERAIEAIIPQHIFVSRSSQVLLEYKEYERGIATWLNAWIGPVVKRYLERLTEQLPEATISVMQSCANTIAAHKAGERAVRLLLSGPAGGLEGARTMGHSAGQSRLLTFDMGGTSTDVALIDGELQLTNEGRISGYPIAIPMVDMHTIGAGGGSIAYVDNGGLLQVGPQSAGAAPGPACYGRGGRAATVTDANLVLGRLRAEAFLGGTMTLDSVAARQSLLALGQQLELSVEQVASGIIRIANEHMAQALRVISLQRGIDPRDYTLTSFGGAGGLHVCALADLLAIKRALVPLHGGVLSALGMLTAPRGRNLSRTLGAALDSLSTEQLESCFIQQEEQGRRELGAEGVHAESINIERSLDLCYQGQSYTLTVPWQSIKTCADTFEKYHQQRYGHALPLALELVNVRTAVRGHVPTFNPAPMNVGAQNSAPCGGAGLYGIQHPVNIYRREQLAAGQTITGPALITETVSTTYIAPHWSCRADDYGNLLLKRKAS